MKSFLYVSSIIVSIAIVIVGHFYYQQKLEAIAAESVPLTLSTNPSPPLTTQEEEKVDETAELTGLLGTWSEVQDTVSMTVFGSTSITNDEDPSTSWPVLFESTINNVSSSSFEVTLIDVERTTSIDVLQSDFLDQVIASQPDVLLFEPFFLNDNGQIRLEDSLDALDIMMEQLKQQLPETEIVLLPANPLNSTGFYLSQVDQLEQYALENEYIYADHWQFWPSTEDTDLNNYIENARPNEAGHVLWAEAMFEVLSQ
ncbi:SGNH/GDSL hydrolase family protein [Alkalihalobacillus deserti]|uniref:SGNH/GDSL hydrolase family protein n=1 Tax=Alkalihalobacillus deserti TaxID=2879466 RepID=UPI001D14B809|nr:SGNH/GDSL hydrolase family protein [Alkalihalobacillus deserti]